MDKDQEFLQTVTGERDYVSLAKLKGYVEEYKKVEKNIAYFESELKTQKAILQQLSEVDIPMLLVSAGLSEIKLDTGEKLSIAEKQFVAIKDQQEYLTFLRNRDEDDIVKLSVDFNKMPGSDRQKLVDFLASYDYSSKDTVHYQTTQKYFRDLLGYGASDEELREGLESGKYLPKEKIKQFADVFTTFQTKIK